MYINTTVKPGAYLSQEVSFHVRKMLRAHIERTTCYEILFYEVIGQAITDLSLPDKSYKRPDKAHIMQKNLEQRYARESAYSFIFNASERLECFCVMCGLSSEYVRQVVRNAIDYGLAKSA